MTRPGLCRFISADGCKDERMCDDAGRPSIRRAIYSTPRFTASFAGVPFPDTRDLAQIQRVYELSDIERRTFYEGDVYTYRERVDPPPPQITVGALARAMFDAEHEAEALTIAEDRQGHLQRALDVMWIRTKRESRDACVGRAAALIERVGRKA